MVLVAAQVVQTGSPWYRLRAAGGRPGGADLLSLRTWPPWYRLRALVAVLVVLVAAQVVQTDPLRAVVVQSVDRQLPILSEPRWSWWCRSGFSPSAGRPGILSEPAAAGGPGDMLRALVVQTGSCRSTPSAGRPGGADRQPLVVLVICSEPLVVQSADRSTPNLVVLVVLVVCSEPLVALVSSPIDSERWWSWWSPRWYRPIISEPLVAVLVVLVVCSEPLVIFALSVLAIWPWHSLTRFLSPMIPTHNTRAYFRILAAYC